MRSWIAAAWVAVLCTSCAGSSPDPEGTDRASTVTVRYSVWSDADGCWESREESRAEEHWTWSGCEGREDTAWGYSTEEVYWSTEGYCVMFMRDLGGADGDSCQSTDPEFVACDPSEHACCGPLSWALCP